MPLLEGTDGIRKMSKSLGNYIGVKESPSDIFGKLMSISDELMIRYYELLTDHDLLKVKKKHPLEAKLQLAQELVSRYHGGEEAKKARHGFDQKFRKREFPKDLKEFTIYGKASTIPIIGLLTQAELVPSRSKAKRLIQNGAVDIDGKKVTNIDALIPAGRTYAVKVGKKRFASVKIEAP